MLPEYEGWKIVQKIGIGSYGSVYEIEKEDFGNTYKAALKVISIPRTETEVENFKSGGMDDASISEYYKSFAAEIVKEFELMTKLKGTSHIVSYEDHVVKQHKDGIGWDIMIRMELLKPLNKYIAGKGGKLLEKEVIKMGVDLCEALERCQKFNIIHRDIKPDNIFVSDSGDFKLGDFGVAKTMEKTMSGMTRTGTPSYMAPEVYKGQPYGFSVDLYSLGIVMYRLLNDNRLPFQPSYPQQLTYEDQQQALIRRLNGDPIPHPAHNDGRLSEVILKACSYDPKLRYSSPSDMKQDLEALLYGTTEGREFYGTAGSPIINTPDPGTQTDVTIEEVIRRQQMKKRILALTGIAAAVVCIALAGSSIYKLVKRAPQAAETSSVLSTELSPEERAGKTFDETGDAGMTITRSYDKNGSLEHEDQIHADGSQGFKFDYTYDEKGNLLTMTQYHADGQVWKREERTYQNGVLSAIHQYEDGLLLEYSNCICDSEGREIARDVFNTDDSLKESHSYVYNEDGSRTEKIEAPAGSFFEEEMSRTGKALKVNRYIHYYDIKGKRIQQEDYAGDQLASYCKVSYDYAYRQTRQSWFYGDQTPKAHVDYHYSEDGSTTEEIVYNEEGKILTKIKTETAPNGDYTLSQYDANDNLIAEEKYNEEGQSLSRDDFNENVPNK